MAERRPARPRAGVGWTAAALALAALCALPAPGRAETCDGEAAYQQVVTTGSGGGARPVGIAIHIMERPGRRCEVRERWTAAKVAAVFGVGAGDPQSVNSAWGATPVRFVVRAVTVREFAPDDAMVMGSGQQIRVPLAGPRGDDAYETAFSALVAQFHRERHVNVYLWRRIGGGPIGFGRSTRTGNGKATVFLDARCGGQSVRTCATLAAHELGHALGLYHAGPGTCGAVDSQFQGLCQFLAATCAEVPLSGRLMRSGGTGRGLCPREVDAAVEQAEADFP